jgi:flavin-dependent dehydrogenase
MLPVSESTNYDVVIVGGRVAGAVTAAFLSDRGKSVLVLEARRLPSPTISTHFFRGDGLVRALDEVGVLGQVLRTGAPALTREYFYVDGEADFRVDPPQEPGDAGFGLSVRRETLDPLIARHVAQLSNVDFRTQVRAAGLLHHDGVICGVRDTSGVVHRAAVVVGADGRRSNVAAWVGAPVQERHPAGRVMYYRYVTGWSGPSGGILDGPEFSVLGNEMVYVFPSDSGTACVALSFPLAQYAEARKDPAEWFSQRLRGHRGLWPRYERAAPLGRLRAGPPHDSVLRYPAGPGWALVGDAGTLQDPWTGFGMDTAARQARVLSNVLTEDPAEWNDVYARERDRVTLERFTETVAGAPDLRILFE